MNIKQLKNILENYDNDKKIYINYELIETNTRILYKKVKTSENIRKPILYIGKNVKDILTIGRLKQYLNNYDDEKEISIVLKISTSNNPPSRIDSRSSDNDGNLILFVKRIAF